MATQPTPLNTMARADRRRRNEGSPNGAEAVDPGDSTLESFVARLHDEGVEAGRQEAERLVREARLEADRIVEQARKEAERLSADAEARAAEELSRGRAELEMAARDAVLELSEVLAGGLGALLARSVEEELRDPDFLRSLLKEAVGAYARADAEGQRPIEVRVPAELEDQLESWAFGELARGIRGGPAGPDGEGGAGAADGTNRVELSATLERAGFEYRAVDGTVEVDVAAAVDLLLGLLTPRLRKTIEEGVRDLPQ